jgi:ribosome-binding ATPase YchF (GTP1/OBG family)
MLYVANVDEGTDEVPPAIAARAEAAGAVAVAVSARVEAELSELGDPEEAAAMRAELGIGESGLERVIHAAWRLLDLIAFFTADAGKEAMARALTAGSSAYEAAAEVHTDMQRGFVRAEVISWEELVDAGGYAPARDRGLIRIEGRDYRVEDGEVLHFKH